MRKYLDSVPESRKAGPQSRRRLRKAGASQKVSGMLGPATVNGSGPAGGNGGSGAIKAPSTAPGTTSNGRKGFVIQRGTMASAAQTPPPIGVPSGPAYAAPAPAERTSRGMSPKAVAIFVISLFGLILLAGLGVLVSVVVSSRNKEKAVDALFVQAQTLENDMPALDAVVVEAVQRLSERDAESRKVIASVGEIVAKALSVPLVVPDLEPPKAVPAPEPEPAAEPAGAPPAAPDVPAAPDAPDVPAAPAEPQPADEPAAAPAAADRPALVAKAEAIFVPARAIRAKLRAAEALRDRPRSPLDALKREAMDQDQWQVRKDRADRRRQDAVDIDAMAKECDALLLGMRRMVPALEREAAGLLEAARRKAETDRLASEQADAEAAKLRAQEAAKARVASDVEYVNSVVERNRAHVDKHHYARVAGDLEKIRPDLATDGGKAALDAVIERYARLESLKKFIVKDLHDNKGLRRGLGTGDIVDADETAVIGVGGQRIPLEDVSVPQWMNLIVRLLETRPADRPLRVIEHGEQLFNAAIFCVVHGGGSETAEAKALTLVKLALQRRTALRADVPRLLPSLAGKELSGD
jgi:hypothetical protein